MTDWTKPQQSDRRRKMLAITLSDESRAKLDEIAARLYEGNRSAAIEDLVQRCRR